MISDVHYEAGASWAKFWSQVESGGDFFVSDEVNFYFFWQNAATDAVVDVRSTVLLDGFMQATAEPGLLWSFWGTDTFGRCKIVDEVRLTVLQWWEQPPTQPLPQPDQTNEVGSVSANGGWGFGGVGIGQSGFDPVYLSRTAHVAYDTLWVPANGVVVFEVGLRMWYSGYDGHGYNAFQAYGKMRLSCPQVELEILAGPPVIHP